MDKEQVSNELKEIVNNFNNNLDQWMKKHDCRANFQWVYGASTDQRIQPAQVKGLEIVSIDKEVFRKPAPDARFVADYLKNNP